MGLIISINGVDFEPYRSVQAAVPLVQKTKATQRVQPIQRDTDHPENFKDVLTAAPSNKYKAYESAQVSPPKVSRKIVHASELMTSPVITLIKDANVSEAKKLLKEHQIRHLPIVDSDKKIIGIISDRNLMLSDQNATVSEIMSTRILAAKANTHIQEIAKALVENKFNSIPILDDEMRLVGMVTSSDLLNSIFKNPNVDLWA